MEKIIKNFLVDGEVVLCERHGAGHINETYKVDLNNNGKVKSYILQRVNTQLFTDMDKLMSNISGVTNFLREKIIKAGGNPDRETLTVIKAKDGKDYYFDKETGSSFRMFLFIEDALALQKAEKPEQFKSSAQAFGKFANMLADYDASTLYETIKFFHDTTVRFENFKKAVAFNYQNRAEKVKEEIKFALDREEYASRIVNKIKDGRIPLKVTHNDTKLNNVLFDKDGESAIAVIDLDTVMPGSILYDFGDSIRFGCNTGAEDEIDLTKVTFSMELFDTYVDGYLSEMGASITNEELSELAFSAILLTYECGIRFLGDYLSGDTYFKIHRENHNLDRARTQFKLVKEMENRYDEMVAIVNKYAKKYVNA